MVPDISIIIPVHNAELTLARAIESCIAQRHVTKEILLIENGSTDSSLQIARDYADRYPYVQLLSSEKVGASNARNMGLRAAKGAFVGFVDADDWAEPDMYATMLEAMNRTNAAVAMCEYYIEGRGRIATNVLHRFGGAPDEIREVLLGPLHREDDVLMGSVWRCLFRREILTEHAARFDANLEIGEDTIFLLATFSRVDCISLVPQPLYHYVRSDDSMTGKTTDDTWRRYFRFLSELINVEKCCGETAEGCQRIANKIAGLYGWIATEYARAAMPVAKKKQVLHDMDNSCRKLLQQCGCNPSFTNVAYKLLVRNRTLLIEYARCTSLIERLKERMQQVDER